MQLEKNVETPSKSGTMIIVIALVLVALLSVAATVFQAAFIWEGRPTHASVPAPHVRTVTKRPIKELILVIPGRPEAERQVYRLDPPTFVSSDYDPAVDRTTLEWSTGGKTTIVPLTGDEHLIFIEEGRVEEIE